MEHLVQRSVAWNFTRLKNAQLMCKIDQKLSNCKFLIASNEFGVPFLGGKLTDQTIISD